MEYLGALGTLIHEKNLKSKFSCQTPFNDFNMSGGRFSLKDTGQCLWLPVLCTAYNRPRIWSMQYCSIEYISWKVKTMVNFAVTINLTLQLIPVLWVWIRIRLTRNSMACRIRIQISELRADQVLYPFPDPVPASNHIPAPDSYYQSKIQQNFRKKCNTYHI